MAGKAFLNRTQWERLLAVAESPRDGALLAVLLWGALRPGEACALNVGDVDLPGEQVLVRTDPDAVFVYLHPRAVELLGGVCRGRKWTEPLFLSSRGKRLSRVQAWRPVRELGFNPGVGAISADVLRRSCAARMLEHGGPVGTIAEHLRVRPRDLPELLPAPIAAPIASTRPRQPVRDSALQPVRELLSSLAVSYGVPA